MGRKGQDGVLGKRIHLERLHEHTTPEGGRPAFWSIAQVGAAAGLLAGRVDLHAAQTGAHNADQRALGRALSAGHAGTLRDVPRAGLGPAARHGRLLVSCPNGLGR